MHLLSQPFTAEGTIIVNAAECEPVLSHNIAAIEIKELPNLYPMGEERAIIRETMGILLEKYSRKPETLQTDMGITAPHVPIGSNAGEPNNGKMHCFF